MNDRHPPLSTAVRLCAATFVAALPCLLVVSMAGPQGLAALQGAAPPGESFRIVGQVVEQGTQRAVMGAVATAFREDRESGEFTPVAVARTDEDGIFDLLLPDSGPFRIQAEMEGRSSALSEALEAGSRSAPSELALIVPSAVLGLAYACEAEMGDAFTAVVGAVLDPVAEIRVPMARVTVQWDEGGDVRTLTTESDESGYYRVCGIAPEARFLRVRGEVLGRRGEMQEFEVLRPTFVFHDVELPLGTGVTQRPDVIQERILAESAARGLSDMGGEIRDMVTGAPVQQAILRLAGTSLQAMTDAEGRFGFGDLQPGRYRLEIRHLGYRVESEPVDLPAGQDLFLRMEVAPQAIEVAGIEVSVRSAVQELTRLTPFRRDIVYGEALAEEEQRGARAFEVLRRSVPGLQVSEINNPGDPNRLCIQTTRRVAGLAGSNCQMVQVIIDDIRVPPGEGGDVLRGLPAADIESMEFLSPTQATTRFGTGGDTANGVVLIYTRGRGPYVSPLRNAPPRGGG